MERVLIVGCGGSGKSTLARKLGDRTGLPVIHLDRLFWREGWHHISREEFDALLIRELEKDRWIIDGDYERTIPLRLQYCDTVVFLDFSRLRCLLGVIKRVITTYGQVRPDMAPGCPERFDMDFLKWVWNWRKQKRDRLVSLLREAKQVNVVVLKNRRQVNRFFHKICKGEQL